MRNASWENEFMELGSFPGGSAIKTLTMQEMQEMRVQSLGEEGPLE